MKKTPPKTWSDLPPDVQRDWADVRDIAEEYPDILELPTWEPLRAPPHLRLQARPREPHPPTVLAAVPLFPVLLQVPWLHPQQARRLLQRHEAIGLGTGARALARRRAVVHAIWISMRACST
jgi:hypothetical protein